MIRMCLCVVLISLALLLIACRSEKNGLDLSVCDEIYSDANTVAILNEEKDDFQDISDKETNLGATNEHQEGSICVTSNHPYRFHMGGYDDWSCDLYEVFLGTELADFGFSLEYVRDYEYMIINEDYSTYINEYSCIVSLPQTGADKPWSEKINAYYQSQFPVYIAEGDEIWNTYHDDWMVARLAYFFENAYVVGNVITVVQSRDFCAWRPDLGWVPFAELFSALDGYKLSVDDLFIVNRDEYLPVLQVSLQRSWIERVSPHFIPEAQIDFEMMSQREVRFMFDYATVAINCSGLVFICPQGTAACNAEGVVFLIAPFEDLREILDPMYFPDYVA